MGAFEKHDRSSHDFADRKVLAQTGQRFCLLSSRLYMQKDGKERWYNDILFEDADSLGPDGKVMETLTFDRTPSRDEFFQDLLDENGFPYHSCYVQMSEFKGKAGIQTRYSLGKDKLPESCPCGWTPQPVTVPAEESSADGDPFLPEFPDEV